MIHIFFVPGMHGSMIELFLRLDENSEYKCMLLDGSMHNFSKQKHFNNISGDFFYNSVSDVGTAFSDINTIIWPMQNHSLKDVFSCIKKNSAWEDAAKVCVYAPSFEYAEINMLMQYYKIAIGKPNTGVKQQFCSNIDNDSTFKNWNTNYTSFEDMQTWEWREWFSLYYPDWITKWTTPCRVCDVLYITNESLINNTVTTLQDIAKHCGKTIKCTQEFADYYANGQKYILTEYKLCNTIVEHSIKNKHLEWDSLNIIAEAIIQQKLRTNGFEIRCNGLNNFPTNSQMLHNLLEGTQNA